MNIIDYIKDKKYIIGGLCILILIVSIIILSFTNKKEEVVILNKKEEKEKICVIDVKGYVIKPGLVKIKCDSRVLDVIEKAKGLKEEADTSIINLSKKVFDSMVLIIYSKDEVNDFINVRKKEDLSDIKCNEIKNDGCINKEDRVEVNIKIEEENNDTDNNLISINTATKEELMTLTGIGEAKAIAIINYRNEHGLFNSIEDIKNVTGIGEKMFEKIKNNIKL